VRRRSAAPSATRDRWLVSYADLLTLLLAFFVVLFAASQKGGQADASHVLRKALESFTQPSQPGAGTGRASSSSQSPSRAANAASASSPAQNTGIDLRLRELLRPEIARGSVAISEHRGAVIISLREAGFYRSGSAELQSGSERILDRIASELRASSCAIRIEGHTDAAPIQTAAFHSNWELSTARATGLVRRFIEQDGIPADRLSAAGFAEFHPLAPENTSEGRARNRRVDIVLLAPEFPLAQ
jgi:chemotaxis protein MotB